LRVCAADIGNAFLYGRCKEKLAIRAGIEFGPLQGQLLIIYKSLYGTKTGSAAFHEHLAEKLRRMGFKPSYADTDFWIRANGDHYEYVACYVDDVLAISRNPMAIINILKDDYVLKGIGIPEYYLGGNVDELGDEWSKDGIEWALSARTYVENVVGKLETLYSHEFRRFKTPMAETYHPELDSTPLVDAESAARYHDRQRQLGHYAWPIRCPICHVRSLPIQHGTPRGPHQSHATCLRIPQTVPQRTSPR
jgi:hypothetical protein